MHTILSLLGIVASFFLIKYRERTGEMIGEAEWMKKFGGVYNVIILAAVFLFFLSLAELTGTSGILLRPFIQWIPGVNRTQPASAGF